MTDEDLLDHACAKFEEHLPGRLQRSLRWLRSPSAKLLRIPLGIIGLLGGLLWFLPVLGAWMLPLGLLLLAQDIKPLRRPVGRAILWLVERWERLRARRNARSAGR